MNARTGGGDYACVTRIVALLCFAWAAGAAACPTCVGPRLGDSEHGAGDAVFSSSTTFGIDWLGPNLQRDELREELGASLSLSQRISLDVAAPLVWRWLPTATSTGTSWGLADVRAEGTFDVVRSESLAASDVFAVVAGAQTSATPLAPDEPYAAQVTSNAFTPRLGLQYRHADQGWGVVVQVNGGWPIEYSRELYAGRFAQLTAAVDYQTFSWLRLQGVVNLKAQEQAVWNEAPVAATGFFAGFLGGQARVRATKWLAVTAAVFAPIFCISDGYSHSPVFRLGVDVSI